MREFQVSKGSAACPKGFVAAGMHCGIKQGEKPDLALVLCTSDGPASAAAMFTRNLMRAAPVEVSLGHLEGSGGRCRAVLINSGCANAATGAEGERRCRSTVGALVASLGCASEEVQVMSTGLIGAALPSEKIEAAIPALAASAKRGGPDGLLAAARAMLTTDLAVKAAETVVRHDGREFRVSGMAKGSGMIHPDMATMLAVILTDAAVSPTALDAALRAAVEGSFHRITVDGDTSTNDTVLALASGEAGEFPGELVAGAIAAVARSLALQVVGDGEGARRVIRVRADDALDRDQALRVARTVASSLLVRTAVAGGDPNWGRIVAAVGRADARVDMEKLRVFAAGAMIFSGNAPTVDAREVLGRAMKGSPLDIEVKLGLGEAAEEYFSCDLTEDYVRINASYST